jgi:methyl-accepting chemotaxis protein
METMSSLANTTQEIQEGAEQMKDSTGRVNDSLREIRGIGEKVDGEIQEIEEKTQGINGSMGRINELNEENRISIDHLFGEIERFRTDKDEVEEEQNGESRPEEPAAGKETETAEEEL